MPQGEFTVHLGQLNLNFAFTPNLVLNLVGQYDNVTDEVGFNARVRWTLTPGSDVYLVFNQLLDSAQGGLRPIEEDLSAKIAWTFRF